MPVCITSSLARQRDEYTKDRRPKWPAGSIRSRSLLSLRDKALSNQLAAKTEQERRLHVASERRIEPRCAVASAKELSKLLMACPRISTPACTNSFTKIWQVIPTKMPVCITSSLARQKDEYTRQRDHRPRCSTRLGHSRATTGRATQ